MSSMLARSVIELLPPDGLRAAAAGLHEKERALAGAFEAAVSRVLAAMIDALADKRRRDGVVALVAGSRAAPALRDVPLMVRQGFTSSSVVAGSRLVEHVLGERAAVVAGEIAQSTGVKAASAYSLLGLAATLAMGLVIRRVGVERLTVQSVLLELGCRPRAWSMSPVLAGLGSAAAAGVLLLFVVWRSAAPAAIDIVLPAPPQVEATAGTSSDTGAAVSSPVVVYGSGLPTPETRRAAPRSGAVMGAIVEPQKPAERGRDAVEESIESLIVGYIEDVARVADGGTWFDLDRVRFGKSVSTLTSDSEEQVETLAEILKLFPAVRLAIAGHTDDAGDPDRNQRLSAARAEAVKAALMARNIDPARLATIGYGASRPIAENDTAEGRARNRRIAVAVTAK